MRNADDLAMILENLGNRVRQIIWGERVWQKGEVKGTKVMEDAYLAGKRIGESQSKISKSSGGLVMTPSELLFGIFEDSASFCNSLAGGILAA